MDKKSAIQARPRLSKVSATEKLVDSGQVVTSRVPRSMRASLRAGGSSHHSCPSGPICASTVSVKP